MKDNPPALESFRQRISWNDLDKNLIEKQLKICVEEDLGLNSKDGTKWQSDITTRYCEITNNGSAYLTAREPMILCGTLIIPIIIKAFELKVTYAIKYNDGDDLQRDEVIGILTGPIKDLAIERSVLNYLQDYRVFPLLFYNLKKRLINIMLVY